MSDSNSNNDRIGRLQEEVREAGIDLLVLTPSPSLTYLTGHAFDAHERLFLLFIPAIGAPAAILPELEEHNWKRLGSGGPDCVPVGRQGRTRRRGGRGVRVVPLQPRWGSNRWGFVTWSTRCSRPTCRTPSSSTRKPRSTRCGNTRTPRKPSLSVERPASQKNHWRRCWPSCASV